MSPKKIKVGIIGGGNGGMAVLDIFKDEPDIEVAGIADINLNAKAMKFAQSSGIPVTDDYRLLAQDDLQIIINVTGSEELDGEIQRIKRPETELIGGRCIWIFRKLLEELKRQAGTDGLTGAYNRVKFNEIIKLEMGRARRYQRPLSISIFDIDDFKRVNDTFGHNAGDSVLISISDIVRKHIRETSYLFRWGGEEFVLLLPEADLEGALTQAERIRQEIAELVFAQADSVTASFGLAQYRENDTADSFLKRADEAMYKAKSGGKNRVVADDRLNPAGAALSKCSC
ncbi:MAG: GGDEF domain-containing protein [Deltaproteobacteria bacterium]|nr:GGDEF domain-containing protein [Deltaproteobacteria bacterium]